MHFQTFSTDDNFHYVFTTGAKGTWSPHRCTQKILKTPFLTEICSAPLICVVVNSGARALKVSEGLSDLENKVQQIDYLSLKLSPLASLFVPPNETAAGNLAAIGHFFSPVTKKAHKHGANAKNAVVYNPCCIVHRLCLVMSGQMMDT